MLINDAHIWIARFDSEDALEEYMEEMFNEDEETDEDDESPISRFAADMGEWFYDHDLVYAQFHEEEDADNLIACWEFPEEVGKRVNAAIEKLGVKNANTSFVADKAEFSNPKSVKGNGYELWYVGQFDGCSI